MKRKIKWLIVSIFLIIAVIVTLLMFININKSDKINISKEEFSKILKDFDLIDDITISQQININNEEIIKYSIDENKYMITYSNVNHPTFYYEENDTLYKVYFENSYWKRRISNEEESTYKITFNLSSYIEKYDLFIYDKKTGYLELMDFNNKKNIQILINDGMVKNYNYTFEDVTYKYSFSFYKNTTVDIPSNTYDVYDKLDLNEWNKLILDTTINYNFTLSSIYQDKIGEELYNENAVILKNDINKLYKLISLTDSNQELYSVLKSNNEYIYTYVLNEWKYETSIPISKTVYNQYEQLPINILNEFYDQVEYNEFDSAYTLKNIVYDDKVYSQIVFKITDGYISYVSLDYTYLLNDKIHNVRNILNFTDFNNTKINITIE